MAPVFTTPLSFAALIALQAPPAAPCSTMWSPPRALMVGKAYVHVEAPQIVATRFGTAFLGDNAFAVEPTDSGFTRVAGWPRGPEMVADFLVRPNGAVAPIPPPRGVRSFIGVRAASHKGVAHVFWAGSADTSSLQFQHVNSLWYARYDGAKWTRPERVLSDTTFTWFQQPSSIIVANGMVHLTTPMIGRTLGDDVLHVVRERRGKGAVTRLGFEALYTNLAIDPKGPLLLATIAGAAPDRARVLVRRSTDGGRTWSEPAVVYRSGRGTAFDPRLVFRPDGSLYVAWIAEDAGAPYRAATVGMARSGDHGMTWTSVPGLTAAPKVRNLWAVSDGQGTVHLALNAGDDSVLGVSLADGQWKDRFTLGPTPFGAMLSALTPDSLVLAWPEWRTAGPERIPALMVSRRTSCPGIPPKR